MALPGTITKEPIEIGWHEDKQGEGQDPYEKGPYSVEPGCGMEGDTTCINCAIWCGNHCGCPSKIKFSIGTIRVISRVTMGVLLWGFFYAATYPPCASEGEEFTSDGDPCVIPGLPGGNLFGILMVFIFGMLGETLIVLIPMPFGLPVLPPLLASLLIGIMLRNVPGIDVAKYINDLWSTRLRNMALGVILARAGLEVDQDQMWELRWVVPRLAFGPCIVEACSYGVFAHWIFDMPYEWSFLLGFVCCAVAPACVVPSMIDFQAKGFGVKHGMPSLCIAAASLDDIVAINCFNILLTIIFGGHSVWYNVFIACAEITLGIVFGLIGGYYLQYIPDRRQYNVTRDRTFLLAIFSFFLIYVTDGPMDIAGAGTLGTLTASFVAAVGWTLHSTEPIAHYFKGFWFYFQPLLFGLTGATVDLGNMDGETIARSFICICICLTFRLATAGNCVAGLGWSHKEKLMTAIAWIPKATVQAAIGGSALSRVNIECHDEFLMDICSEETTTAFMTNSTTVSMSTTGATTYYTTVNGTDGTTVMTCYPADGECYVWLGYATIILTVAVLLILTTAPIGVFLIGIFGPRLLPHDFDDPDFAKEHNNKNKEPIPDNSSVIEVEMELPQVKSSNGFINHIYQGDVSYRSKGYTEDVSTAL